MRILGSVVTLCLLGLTVPSRAQTPTWHLSATVAESCSCVVACPCNFGGKPSRMPCEGNRIISIEKGNYGDVDLAGMQLLVTFNMRTWSKIYVSDKVNDKQMAAVESLLPLAFAGFHKGMLSFTKAPITMDVTDTRVRFSGPGVVGRHGSDARLQRPRRQGAEPAERGVPGLHAVPLRRPSSHQRHALLQPFGHNGFTSHMDVGVASDPPRSIVREPVSESRFMKETPGASLPGRSSRVVERAGLAAVVVFFCVPLFVGLDRWDLRSDEAIYCVFRRSDPGDRRLASRRAASRSTGRSSRSRRSSSGWWRR